MNSTSHSSNVILTLIVCGVELALSHVGSQFCIVRDAIQSFGESEAELVISVYGVEDRKPVFLPHGITAGKSSQVFYL